MLPQDFLDRMREMLGEEYPAFLESCQAERRQALRINSLKVGREEFLEGALWKLSSVPWADNGFYYEKDAAPGRHPYHDAGLYYIQEPSAMAPAEYLMRPLWEKEEPGRNGCWIYARRRGERARSSPRRCAAWAY